MPSYLNNGVEQIKSAEHVIEALPEPNRQNIFYCVLCTSLIDVGNLSSKERATPAIGIKFAFEKKVF